MSLTKRGGAKKPAPKKRLSARRHQDLRTLAGQVGNIIPATSPRKGGFCFQNIAKDLGLAKYWPTTTDTKKEAIYKFLLGVSQNHPRLFVKLFRENFARGIERRHAAGDPVLRREMSELGGTLARLGVNLTAEIEELDLPSERPKVVPPPHAFQRMVDELALHPFLRPECPKLFKDGHLNEAVRKALEKYEVYVQSKSGLTNIGTDLMGNAFNENNPKIRIADVAERRGRGLQEGFKLISMGSMAFWRNYLSHGNEGQMSHHDAVSVLATVSHLMNFIDEATK